jgi:ribosome-binding protein aMBF1 (putative translation factor)
MNAIKTARIKAGLTQQQMSDLMGIPKRTIENWDMKRGPCPPYVERLVIKELTEIAHNKKTERYDNAAVGEGGE